MRARFLLSGVVSTFFILGCMCGDLPDKIKGLTGGATTASSGEFKTLNNNIGAVQRGRAPGSHADDSIKGRYIVKLSDDAAQTASVDGNGRVRTGRKGLDEGQERAKVKKARALRGAEVASAQGAQGARGGRRHRVDNLYAMDSDLDLESFKGAMGNDGVEWVEPVRRYKMAEYNDPYYKVQWNMQNLKIEQVHAATQGQGVVVAIIDSGVTQTEDGPANIVKGYDFVDNDSDPRDSGSTTGGSHGTHVAGTIAQTANNGKGVVGIAPAAQIMPLRVGDENGLSSDAIAAAIVYAVDNGAQVINMSLGGPTASQAIQDACEYAYENNVVIVAATGNNGYDDQVLYPAAFPTVIAVGAHDYKYQETAYSNAGREVALLAPGGDTAVDLNSDGQPDGILQATHMGNEFGYMFMQGTSMASPHVAGAAALLVSRGIRTPDAVREALVATATPIQGKSYGALNILAALEYRGGAGSASATNAPDDRDGKGDRDGRGDGKGDGRDGGRNAEAPRSGAGSSSGSSSGGGEGAARGNNGAGRGAGAGAGAGAGEGAGAGAGAGAGRGGGGGGGGGGKEGKRNH